MGWGIRGIRGATTVEENSAAAIEQAVVELLEELSRRNRLNCADIGCVIFTATADLDAIFPSQAARLNLPGWEQVALLDLTQMAVPGSLPRCVRVLLQVNTDLPQQAIHHVYLRGAQHLRPDRLPVSN
ncbi:chorismate mutase [Gloeobacter kilaueensis]|uniref:chorismate mutase n=1 Tax=Gloeobacter kilaueensis (strain ATCC BAA-2537 / CCAP 1431/1 / ULC 316 / JS1) TaxID=1183438 RepID=U5QIX8_GLOK1|nr:chorismate mutase [Gloeobacter kilaueensis]AGY58932.1 chorismate mutase [Gloeobacter kilaueensis JS1]